MRKRFYATYAEEETDPTKRQDTLKHAFSRALKNAQDRSLIGAAVRTNGQPVVWMAGGTGTGLNPLSQKGRCPDHRGVWDGSIRSDLKPSDRYVRPQMEHVVPNYPVCPACPRPCPV